jgi:hypothetical protein
LNIYTGNGAATSKNPAATNSNNFGLGLIGTSEGNLVEKNKIGGNVNGLLISSPRRNQIRRNIIAGNPPVQVSLTFGKGIGADIQELSPAGTHTFEENYCLTYAGSTTPAPCPNISERDNDEDVAAHRAATPFQGSFRRATVQRNRLAFPQARLLDLGTIQPAQVIPHRP